MHPTLSCLGNVRETGYGLEPELIGFDPANPDWDEPDPLAGWLEQDQLTLIDHPRITACGTIGIQCFAHEETGEVI